jgi:hypothetical protein
VANNNQRNDNVWLIVYRRLQRVYVIPLVEEIIRMPWLPKRKHCEITISQEYGLFPKFCTDAFVLEISTSRRRV